MTARPWHEEAVAALQGIAGVGLLRDVSLADRTYIGVGGKAPVFLAPVSVEALAAAVRRLCEAEVPFDVLGAGSNLLVEDAGPSFVVVSTAGLTAERSGEGGGRVASGAGAGGSSASGSGAGGPGATGPRAGETGRIVAGAGVPLPRLTQRMQRAGLAGLEFAEGIPGSVGGAVRMNAGWHEEEFGALVTALVVVTRQGDVETLTTDAATFAYRRSPGLGDRLVAEATLSLTPDDPEAIARRMRAFRDHRVRTQPAGERNAGCMFKNPKGDHAGRLIDQCGLKGTAVGRARVSEAHANFFINAGGATFADVALLMDRVRDTVLAKTGVTLEPEVVTWR